jgi:hypothetical protein
MENAMSTSRPRYAIVVLLEFEPAWLALTREERGRYAALVQEIVARHAAVRFRWFDADAFGHGFTDFVICECEELEAYHFMWEELRDTALFSTPYLKLKDSLLGMERGYERYEAQRRAAG